MAKKHWIYIKRGLSEDPKHREKMGECVWLYMHIIDRADWEMGIVYDWRDTQEAADMSMPVDTLRRQRQKLSDLNYIRCEQRQHGQNIYIYEWRNPRDYGNEVKNPRNEGSHTSPPSEFEGLNQGDNQGLNQGDKQVTLQVKTPTYNSESISKSFSEKTKDFPIEWKIATNTATNENMKAVLSKEKREKEVADSFERAMGYNPLPWWSEPDLKALLKFLMDKTPEEVQNFAAWSKDKYSTFPPAKARQYPRRVIELWPLALAREKSTIEQIEERMAEMEKEYLEEQNGSEV